MSETDLDIISSWLADGYRGSERDAEPRAISAVTALLKARARSPSLQLSTADLVAINEAASYSDVGLFMCALSEIFGRDLIESVRSMARPVSGRRATRQAENVPSRTDRTRRVDDDARLDSILDEYDDSLYGDDRAPAALADNNEPAYSKPWPPKRKAKKRSVLSKKKASEFSGVGAVAAVKARWSVMSPREKLKSLNDKAPKRRIVLRKIEW